MQARTKRTALTVACLLVALALGACADLYPTVGRLPDGARQERVEASTNYREEQMAWAPPSTAAAREE